MRRAIAFFVAGFCVFAGSLLTGCAVAENIGYQHAIYKATYNYLRAAECQNNADQQMAYESCFKSYAEDYESYRKLRDRYVNNKPGKES